MAVAPAARAAAPSASRARGRRWARTRSSNPAVAAPPPAPARSTSRPAADDPSGPVTKRWSPGRAPDRSTGPGDDAPPSPAMATDTTSVGADVMSPPTTGHP